MNLEATFDIQAVAEISGVLNRSPSLSAGIPAMLKQLLSDGSVSEDIVRVSMLRTLNLLGDEAFTRTYLSDQVLATRIESSTGLVRPIIDFPGTVEATYLVSRLLDQHFPHVANSTTRDALFAHISSPETDRLTKLKALVALRRSGDPRWNDHLEIPQDAIRTFRSVVTVEEMPSYLVTMEAAVQVVDKVAFSRLEKFEAPTGDDRLASQALTALAGSSYFSNGSEVSEWFPDHQKKLQTLIKEPREPFSLYVAGMAAMASSPLSELNSSNFTSATEELESIRGCKKHKTLYRAGLEPTAPCSLSVSVRLMAVSGAYGGG